ncbi:hypothetical protein CPS_1776 [Colwellia psychrerythraea 34H]|uniref:Uncharacterized protein n=1 Tax=Colwellia psychrerythraea (strain 34H / ATCC BAA-681) TaxID=167879 RepID=Q484K8_COLP3|nr:hypothetical protein CPS_1776 [Colwellia psychrerythraea 34H]
MLFKRLILFAFNLLLNSGITWGAVYSFIRH